MEASLTRTQKERLKSPHSDQEGNETLALLADNEARKIAASSATENRHWKYICNILTGKRFRLLQGD